MANEQSKGTTTILASDDLNLVHGISRRDFVKYSAGTIAGIYFGAFNNAFGASGGNTLRQYPIEPHVATTLQRMLSFPLPAKPAGPNSGTGLYLSELPRISEYRKYGYGSYTFGGGLPAVQRFDIMPAGYSTTAPSLTRIRRLLDFFAISDIHITDKEVAQSIDIPATRGCCPCRQ